MTPACHGAPGLGARAGRRAGLAVLAAIGLTLAMIAGCRHRGAPGPHTADERDLRRLERQAQRDLDCSAVRPVRLLDAVYQVDGCGRLQDYALVCARRRCNWTSVEAAATRAARDLGCPAELLAANAPSATRRDFAGCGATVTYSLRCGAASCDWTYLGTTPLPASSPATATWATSLDAAAIPPPPGGPAGDSDPIVIPPPPGAAPPTLTVEVEIAIPPPPP